MKINRTKNAARNMMMGFINKIIVLLLPFVVRTAFIYSLGAEYLGLNSLFSSILSVLSVAELGFSSAVVLPVYISSDRNGCFSWWNSFDAIFAEINQWGMSRRT